jgi:hypothetical protein
MTDVPNRSAPPLCTSLNRALTERAATPKLTAIGTVREPGVPKLT